MYNKNEHKPSTVLVSGTISVSLYYICLSLHITMGI